tara:strand:+ start:31 stop:1035 length:1005 start_codon:yes stop_codon:yes gene_type:complete
MNKTILAIETSCDDTSASIIFNGNIKSNIISSQIDHKKLGGVVPEIASRSHQKNIIYIVDSALSEAGINKKELDAIAFTVGPGLLGSLLVGSTFAKSFGYSLGIPIIGVNHLKAHAFSHTINKKDIKYPFLSLLVSGGHTQIILVKSYNNMEVVGETRDDAVGEAFDKCAKIMGLDYPGGPLIDKYSKNGDPNLYSFPDTIVPELDFSFSGIKTSFLYFINDKIKENKNFISENINNISASIQKKLIDMLLDKLIIALDKYNVQDISICGGVAANSLLREEMVNFSNKFEIKVNIPKMEYCTDNAAMIANYASYMYDEKKFSDYDIVPFSKNSI